VLIMQDAVPLIKTFLKPVGLSGPAHALLIRCLVAFLMHLGKMSASQAAGSIRTDGRHRAQICRFLGRAYWRRVDVLGPLRNSVLELEAKEGTFFFLVDQTVCSFQGQCVENTYNTRNTKRRPTKSQRKQKKTARRSCHCFVMGLLITPSGIRIPFYRPFYTKEYCQKKGIQHRSQADLAAALIEELPAPEAARVVVLGDTAFDAEAIRNACHVRHFTWIVPVNPERVLAGEKPRPKVSSLNKGLDAEQMARIEVHAGRGKYVAYRRIARCRIGPKLKPRTFYVHEERRDVHSVGKVRLFFSTMKAPVPGQPVDVQKILMTNDEERPLREIIEAYQLRWQIELFFKELKSQLGLHHYQVRQFEKVDCWVRLCLTSFLYLEWLRGRKLRQQSLSQKQRKWWEHQRTHGIASAVRQTAERRELDLIAKAIETDSGRRRLARLLAQSHPKEYQAMV
jgi:hypothetical protein